MLTQQNKRKRSSSYQQMTIISSPENKNLITKLCSSILICMQNLKNYKTDILLINDINQLKILFITFQKEEKIFVELQKKFNEIIDSQEYSEQLQRLKQKIKIFYETFNPQQVEYKLQKMKQNLSYEYNEKEKKKKQYQFNEIQLENHNNLTGRLLQQDQQEIKVLQKMMQSIKKMSLDISSLIYQQGTVLKIAAQKMHSAKKNIKEGKQSLLEANTYQQDTNKKKIFFCLLIVVIITIILMIMFAAKK